MASGAAPDAADPPAGISRRRRPGVRTMGSAEPKWLEILARAAPRYEIPPKISLPPKRPFQDVGAVAKPPLRHASRRPHGDRTGHRVTAGMSEADADVGLRHRRSIVLGMPTTASPSPAARIAPPRRRTRLVEQIQQRQVARVQHGACAGHVGQGHRHDAVALQGGAASRGRRTPGRPPPPPRSACPARGRTASADRRAAYSPTPPQARSAPGRAPARRPPHIPGRAPKAARGRTRPMNGPPPRRPSGSTISAPSATTITLNDKPRAARRSTCDTSVPSSMGRSGTAM